MIELNRGAKQYKEIESFADYELTQCVIYEMAIRTPKFKKQTDGAAAYSIDDEVYKILYRGRTETTEDSTKMIKDYSQITLNRSTKREGYSISTEVRTVFKDKNESENIKTIKDFDQYIKDDNEGNTFSESTIAIHENFKRPAVTDRLVSKRASVELDLSRPLDELIAYITHIKQDIEGNKKILKAPIELFGNELQKADDISRMCTETKNGKEICFDGRKGITRTQKIADMFFVYDATKEGAKELAVRTALSEYYISIGKQTDMSDKTFRKYRDIAIDYIVKERYKELATGVKQ